MGSDWSWVVERFRWKSLHRPPIVLPPAPAATIHGTHWPMTYGHGSLGSSDCYRSSTIGLVLSSLRSPRKWAPIGHGLQSNFVGNHSTGHRSSCLLLLRRQSMEPTGNRRLWIVESSPVLSPDLSGLISSGVLSPLISVSLSLSLIHYLTVSRCGEQRRKRNQIRERRKEEKEEENNRSVRESKEDKKKEREV